MTPATSGLSIDTGKGYVSSLDIPMLRAWANAVARRSGLRVIEDPAIMTPCTSKTCIRLPRFNAKMTVKDYVKLRGYMVHEIGHHEHGPRCFDLMEKYEPTSPIRPLLNIFEDDRTERINCARHAGDALVIAELYEYIGTELKYETYKRLTQNWTLGMAPDSCKIESVINAVWINAYDYCPVKVQAADRLLHMLQAKNPHLFECLDKLDSVNFYERLNNLRTEEDSEALARDVFQWLWDKPPEQEEQGTSEGKGGKSGGESEAESSESEPKSGGEIAHDGKPGEGEHQNKSHEAPKTVVIPYNDQVGSQHDYGDVEYNNGTYGSGASLDYTEYNTRWSNTYEYDSGLKVIDYEKGEA